MCIYRPSLSRILSTSKCLRFTDHRRTECIIYSTGHDTARELVHIYFLQSFVTLLSKVCDLNTLIASPQDLSVSKIIWR